MFQFRRFPSYAYFVQRRMTAYCAAGFPHSEIHGSMDICSSPWLIAACHVLLRLPVPRHSPCALSSLTCGVASAGSLPASACLSACGAASLPLLLRLFLANPLRWALLGFIGTFACLPGLEKTWFSFKNYAGFSRVLWLNCIYPASSYT